MFDNPNLEEQRWVVIDDKNLYGSERGKKQLRVKKRNISRRTRLREGGHVPQSWFEGGGGTGNGKDEDREATNNATHKKTTLSAI